MSDQSVNGSLAMNQARDEDQQLLSTVDGRQHHVRDPHIPARTFTHKSS